MEEALIAKVIGEGGDPTFARDFVRALNKHKLLSDFVQFVADCEKYEDGEFMLAAAMVYSFVKYQEAQLNFG